MTRTRHCLSYHGEGCKGDKKQERKCPNMCPQSKTTFFIYFYIFKIAGPCNFQIIHHSFQSMAGEIGVHGARAKSPAEKELLAEKGFA